MFQNKIDIKPYNGLLARLTNLTLAMVQLFVQEIRGLTDQLNIKENKVFK